MLERQYEVVLRMTIHAQNPEVAAWTTDHIIQQTKARFAVTITGLAMSKDPEEVICRKESSTKAS